MSKGKIIMPVNDPLKPQYYMCEKRRSSLQDRINALILSARSGLIVPYLEVWDIQCTLIKMASVSDNTIYHSKCHTENLKWVQSTYKGYINDLPFFPPVKNMKKEMAIIKNIFARPIQNSCESVYPYIHDEPSILLVYNTYLQLFNNFIFIWKVFEACSDISNTIGYLMLTDICEPV